MNARPQIWLGDVARCLATLQPRDDDTRATLLRMLGFQLRVSEPRRARPDEPQTSATTPSPDGTADGGGAGSAATSAELGRLPLLERGTPRTRRRPLPWTTAEALPPVSDQHLYGRLPHEPLLEPRWSRELLYAALAIEVADGPLDAVAAVEAVARGELLDVLPQLTRWSLSRGVQLLLDDGAGMEPFRQDAREVAQALRCLVGRSAVKELRFEASPALGVADTVFTPSRPYVPPEPTTPVVVVSDLGMSPGDDRPREGAWLELAQRLAQRGSPLIAFVPYGSSRWPARLARALILIHWDRVTTVSAVKTLRQAHRNVA